MKSAGCARFARKSTIVPKKDAIEESDFIGEIRRNRWGKLNRGMNNVVKLGTAFTGQKTYPGDANTNIGAEQKNDLDWLPIAPLK